MAAELALRSFIAEQASEFPALVIVKKVRSMT